MARARNQVHSVAFTIFNSISIHRGVGDGGREDVQCCDKRLLNLFLVVERDVEIFQQLHHVVVCVLGEQDSPFNLKFVITPILPIYPKALDPATVSAQGVSGTTGQKARGRT